MHEDCKYTYEDIDKIAGYVTWSNRKKVSTLKHIDCVMYCNLGIDSTIAEKKLVKQRSRNIYRVIKNIDESLGKLLLDCMDR